MADKAELTIEDDAVSDLPEQRAPETGKPQSVSEAADSIADLLGGDLEETPDPKAKPGEDDEDASDPLGDDEDVAGDEADDDADGPEKATAGKYVSGSAKYKMADGTEITVQELARNSLYQRDYSKKTEEVAREREVITKEKTDVAQLSKTLKEERDYVIWFAETFAPKQPQVRQDIDPLLAEIEYNRDLRHYQAFAESYRQFKSMQAQDDQRKTGETQQQAAARAKREVGQLFERIKIDPNKEPAKAKAFFEEIEQRGKEFYGLESNQIADLVKSDHRAALVLRDAIRYRKGQATAPKVQEKLKQVPKMVRQPTARIAPDQQQTRALRSTGEKLRQTGSLNDGIAAIEALLSQQ